MKCHNHPSAPAIENCARCEVPLCGMCANFLGDEVLCETCQEVREAENTVATRTRELERPEPVAATPEYDEAVLQSARKKETSWVAVQLGIIAVCVVILILRLIVFPPGNPSGGTSADNFAQVQALSSLAQCLVQFQQIGESLVAGETLPEEITCPGSSLPMVVTETGTDIIVHHPQPSIFGYSQLSVSRSNPDPELLP